MQKELNEIKVEVLEAQKKAVLREVSALIIQLPFVEEEHERKVATVTKIKNKEQKEHGLQSLANEELQKIIPMRDNIDYKTKYYEYLCKQE